MRKDADWLGQPPISKRGVVAFAARFSDRSSAMILARPSSCMRHKSSKFALKQRETMEFDQGDASSGPETCDCKTPRSKATCLLRGRRESKATDQHESLYEAGQRSIFISSTKTILWEEPKVLEWAYAEWIEDYGKRNASFGNGTNTLTSVP